MRDDDLHFYVTDPELCHKRELDQKQTEWEKEVSKGWVGGGGGKDTFKRSGRSVWQREKNTCLVFFLCLMSVQCRICHEKLVDFLAPDSDKKNKKPCTSVVPYVTTRDKRMD